MKVERLTRWLLGALIIALAVGYLFALLLMAPRANATAGGGGHTPVTLCHRTGSTDGGNQHNGYSLITVDISSAGQARTAKGHNTHEQVGNGPGPDLIPPYTYGDFSYPGHGLDWVFADGETGAEVLAAGCTFATPTPTPPPTTPPPTSPPPTSPPPTSPPPTHHTWTPTWTPKPPVSCVTKGTCKPPTSLAFTGFDKAKAAGAGALLLSLGLGALWVARKKTA